jgi:hypothetical protein
MNALERNGIGMREIAGRDGGCLAGQELPPGRRRRGAGPARQRPGSGGSSPLPPGAPGRAAHPGCAGTPGAGSPWPAAPPAPAPFRGPAAGPACSDMPVSSSPGAGVMPAACPASGSGAAAGDGAPAGPGRRARHGQAQSGPGRATCRRSAIQALGEQKPSSLATRPARPNPASAASSPWTWACARPSPGLRPAAARRAHVTWFITCCT